MFREDLFYRLNVININLPPLRERDNDIVDLSNHFISIYSDNLKKIDESGQKFLKKYEWPGNIRELENLIKRVCALVNEKIINHSQLEEHIDKKRGEDFKNNFHNTGENLSNSIKTFFENFFNSPIDEKSELNLHEKFITEIEKPLIMKTLKYYNGNQIKSAKLLGINRNTLRTKILKYNIPGKFGKK
tara:strand:- start:20 stop:583 length:564 start_codon:yes stop_codon:yes gene_type:complete